MILGRIHEVTDGDCAAVAELGPSLTPEANCVFLLTGGFSMKGTSLNELRITVCRWFQCRALNYVSFSYSSVNKVLLFISIWNGRC